MREEAAMPVPARVSVVTLGVAHVPRAATFYQALGWEVSGEVEERFAVFRTAGARLALYSLEGIAEEAGQTPAARGTMRVALAVNVERRELVDEALAAAVAAGGSVAAPAQERFWGGYSGYFADPDGHAWEVAFNPFWPLGEDGLPQLD
jgi:hypothetical protein